jgi:AcrR family transcriptional regulator
MTGRQNQIGRTRKDLLQAAARLLKQGRKPSLDDVAEEARVSRATAYRYFPGVESLLVEAVVDVAVPEAGDLFGASSSNDPVKRLLRADEALHKAISENEVPLRMMLAHSLEQRAKEVVEGPVPVRQNRRAPLIEAALEPAQDQFDPKQLETLRSALALIIGTEAMVVFKDVLQLDDVAARNVRRWAIEALVEAAKRRSKKKA